MGEQFVAFQSFSDLELATAFTEMLDESSIPYKLLKVPQVLSSDIIGTTSSPDFVLQLRPGDFSKAHRSLREYFKPMTETVEKDYYLFEFSNNELFDIISRPDEWGYFDYQLAQKILTDRGQEIDDLLLQKLNRERSEFLGKPEKAGFLLFSFAYLLILIGFIYTVSPVFSLYDFTFCSPIVSFFIGRHVFRNTKVLPDGQSVYSYRPSDRKHGNVIIYLSLSILFISIVKYLIYGFVLNNA